MIRIALFAFALMLFELPCSGFYEHAGDIDLAELKKLKGLAIATREGESAEDLFIGSHNKNLVGFTIGWLKKNDLLGKGYVEKFLAEVPNPVGGGPVLTKVELYGTDAAGRTVFVTPLIFPEIGGGELGEQFGEPYTCIEFSIDKSLIKHSFIRFYEYIGIHATQWTDVYLGSKPARRQQGNEPSIVAPEPSPVAK